MSLPTFEPFTRVPIYQTFIGKLPWICTDAELGALITRPLQPAVVHSCLGSLWSGRTHPDMVEIFRWIRPAPHITAHEGLQQHCRIGPAPNPGGSWTGYVENGSLGWAFPAGTHAGAGDLVDLQPMEIEALGADGGWFYTNRIEHYPGVGWWPPGAAQYVDGHGLRLHAPQVVRVSYDTSSKQISLAPDELDVTTGGGAPIYWLRGNGMVEGLGGAPGQAADTDSTMQWSFADLVFDDTPPVPAGRTYAPAAQFVLRHMTSSEVLVIDRVDVTSGPAREFPYRLSVLDHTDGKVRTIDPKVRNTSGSGSGASTGGGAGGQH